MRTQIEIKVINEGKEYQVIIREYINEKDNWHSIIRITTSPVLPNVQRVGYWLIKWADFIIE